MLYDSSSTDTILLDYESSDKPNSSGTNPELIKYVSKVEKVQLYVPFSNPRDVDTFFNY